MVECMTFKKRDFQFFSEQSLIDSTHEYIQEMLAIVGRLKFIKIRFDTHSETPTLTGNDGAITFIKQRGKNIEQELLGYLKDKAAPAMKRMIPLATKGQVLNFKDYSQCYDACKELSQSYEQIMAFAIFMGQQNLNWDNQEVRSTLGCVKGLNPDTIKKNLEDQNKILLEFVKQNYQIFIGQQKSGGLRKCIGKKLNCLCPKQKN